MQDWKLKVGKKMISKFIHVKKYTLKHILEKLLNSKDKKQILKGARREKVEIKQKKNNIYIQKPEITEDIFKSSERK